MDAELAEKIADGLLDLCIKQIAARGEYFRRLLSGTSTLAITQRDPYGQIEVCMWAVMDAIYKKAAAEAPGELPEIVYNTMKAEFVFEENIARFKNNVDALLYHIRSEKVAVLHLQSIALPW